MNIFFQGVSYSVKILHTKTYCFRWEESKRDDGLKWHFLEHKGPLMAPLYTRLPPNVKFFYDGKHMVLSDEAEEVAGFYARMIEHEYTTKKVFNTNFLRDWRKVRCCLLSNIIHHLTLFPAVKD